MSEMSEVEKDARNLLGALLNDGGPTGSEPPLAIPSGAWREWAVQQIVALIDKHRDATLKQYMELTQYDD